MPNQGPAGGVEPEKPAGVAEQAPKTPNLLQRTPVLPTPRNRRQQWKLLEIDGYFRFRGDYLKNLNLSFSDVADVGGAPFPRPIGCSVGAISGACKDSLRTANMRLKLAPTINVDETTSIFTEIDVLDNVVLGSTPADGGLTGAGLPPIGAFEENQAPPVAGQNSTGDSITVRRAWAEVALPLGLLKVGRMPNHWGLGIMANGGYEDTFASTLDWDAELGDTVDRLSFSRLIPGTNIRGGLATDWSMTRLASNQTDLAGRSAQGFDLDDNDDVSQWLITLSRFDSKEQFADRVAQGKVAFNWGIYFAYRKQNRDYNTSDTLVGDAPDGLNYTLRNYKAYVPDLFAKAAYKNMTLEVELAGQFGSIGRLDEYDLTEAVDIAQMGGVGRFTATAFGGELRTGVEVGFATGDQWDGTPPGSIHVSDANLVGGEGDTTLSRFIFDREYKVDLIFFRELMGAVSNATYVKPYLNYDLTKSLTMKVANITAFANKPVATPGNSAVWGTEFDFDLGYTNGGFHAGLAYGFYIPLAAMNHPADDTSGDDEFGFTGNTGDAGNAHTLQSRIVLSF